MKTVERVGIKNLKDNLSAYLRQVKRGVRVLVTDRDEVVAEIGKPRRNEIDELPALLCRVDRSRRAPTAEAGAEAASRVSSPPPGRHDAENPRSRPRRVNAVYLETSAVLRWLFGEPDARRIAKRIQETPEPVASVLTILEANRRWFTPSGSDLLGVESFVSFAFGFGKPCGAGISWKSRRTSRFAPESPSRSSQYAPRMRFISRRPCDSLRPSPGSPFDERILANLGPLGLARATLDAERT